MFFFLFFSFFSKHNSTTTSTTTSGKQEDENMGGSHEVYDQYVTKDGVRFALLEIGSTKHMELAYKKLLVVMGELFYVIVVAK